MMKNPTTVVLSMRALRSLTFAAVMALSVDAFGQQNDDERAKTTRVADILIALGSQDGRHIADLGSSDGFYTLRIAKAVAPTGRAYAIDIDQKALDQVRDRRARRSVHAVYPPVVRWILDDSRTPPVGCSTSSVGIAHP